MAQDVAPAPAAAAPVAAPTEQLPAVTAPAVPPAAETKIDAPATIIKAEKPAVKKAAVKKVAKKKTAPKAKKAVTKKPVVKKAVNKSVLTKPTVALDPNVSEPTEEMIAIQTQAEKKFWNGKKPMKEQAAAASMPADTSSLKRASASNLAGVTFDDQPLRMPASDAFQRSLNTVAFELGRPCRNQEYLGWPLRQNEQDRVDRIFNDTIEKFKARGFSVKPHAPRSVGDDVSVFTADRVDGKNDKRILGVWSAGEVGLLLLICDTEEPGSKVMAKPKAEPKKTAPKKVVVKKKTAPKVVKKTSRVQVIPGALKKPDVAPEFKKEEAVAPTPAPAAVAPAPAPTPAAEPAAAPSPAAPPAAAPAPAAAAPAPAFAVKPEDVKAVVIDKAKEAVAPAVPAAVPTPATPAAP
jgi:hypothetical protein